MMKSKLILSGKDAGDDIQPVVSDALEKQSAFAHARFKKFARECRTFEERFDMASEQFFDRFEAGELGDDEQWFDWYAAYRGRMLWEKKYNILRGISWER
jgi:hypothetical protein